LTGSSFRIEEIRSQDRVFFCLNVPALKRQLSDPSDLSDLSDL